jgi:hypothetical protein
MKSEISPAAVATDPAVPTELASPPPLSPLLPPSRIRLSPTHRGARLARLLCGQQLEDWDIPRSAPVSGMVTAIVAELAANAVTHGRTAGRDFEVRLARGADLIRIEVIDTRPDRLPQAPRDSAPPPLDSPGGRGLLLVAAYADRWGWAVRDRYTKVVWAEVGHRAA